MKAVFRFAILVALWGGSAVGQSISDKRDEGEAAYRNRDFGHAFELLAPIAQTGDARAELALGVMYDHGEGVPRDFQKAAEFYRQAAMQNDIDAQVFLGIMYGLGRGVAKDDALAAQWFRKAADRGSARAQSLLGDMYSNGRGVPKNEIMATSYYERAFSAYKLLLTRVIRTRSLLWLSRIRRDEARRKT